MTFATLETHSGLCDQRGLVQLIPHMRAFARSLCQDVTESDDSKIHWLHKGFFLFDH